MPEYVSWWTRDTRRAGFIRNSALALAAFGIVVAAGLATGIVVSAIIEAVR